MHLIIQAFIIAAFLTPMTQLRAEEPSAAEIVRLARLSASFSDHSMKGSIRQNGWPFQTPIPFQMDLHEKEIRFSFYKENSSKKGIDQTICLQLNDNRHLLREIIKGSNKELPIKRYSEKIRSTNITYEDLSMRYLYWPDPKRLSDARAKGGECWVIEAVNPLDHRAPSAASECGSIRKAEAWPKAKATTVRERSSVSFKFWTFSPQKMELGCLRACPFSAATQNPAS